MATVTNRRRTRQKSSDADPPPASDADTAQARPPAKHPRPPKPDRSFVQHLKGLSFRIDKCLMGEGWKEGEYTETEELIHVGAILACGLWLVIPCWISPILQMSAMRQQLRIRLNRRR